VHLKKYFRSSYPKYPSSYRYFFVFLPNIFIFQPGVGDVPTQHFHVPTGGLEAFQPNIFIFQPGVGDVPTQHFHVPTGGLEAFQPNIFMFQPGVGAFLPNIFMFQPGVEAFLPEISIFPPGRSPGSPFPVQTGYLNPGAYWHARCLRQLPRPCR